MKEFMKQTDVASEFLKFLREANLYDEYFDEFSYATEHLSYDAVISVLTKTIKSLKIIKNCIPGNWSECIRWCKDRLKEVWLDRGPFPALGFCQINCVI